jgi:murein DD-endopeptidase MepM/ murein hydrolase activator NlpD
MRGLIALWLLTCVAGSAAGACDTLEASASPLPLDPPVSGEGVRRTTLFGMQFHPLLQKEKMHTGVDWSAPNGTPVVAVKGGTVVAVGRRGEYGNIVIIDHGASWRTLYAHLSKFDVSLGDCVSAGAVIGRVGATGLTNGPVVHFELLQYGWPTDPLAPAQR